MPRKNPQKSRRKPNAFARARRAAHLVAENLVSSRKKSHRKILLEAGYKQSVADNPKGVFGTEAFKAEIAPVLLKYNSIRDNALAVLEAQTKTKKFKKLHPSDVSTILKNTTSDMIKIEKGDDEDETGRDAVADLFKEMTKLIRTTKK